MDSARAQYVVDRADAEGYEPDVIDGAQVGEFHQIEPVDPADKLDVCLRRADPATCDYLFESDEAFHVVEGAATVELPDSGERGPSGGGRRVLPCRHTINLDDHAAVQKAHGDRELA